MALKNKDWRNLATGLAFLAPNIIGFLVFTLVPLLVALAMAFTDWDLTRQNMFKPGESIHFTGLDNFRRLFNEPELWKFFGNTLFMMLGIPFGIAGSLIIAIMLSQDLKGGGNKRLFGMLLAGAGLVGGLALLTILGMGGTSLILLLGFLAGAMLIGGVAGGVTVYRTIYYLPHFTSGVAIFVLWKKLYNPTYGPINTALAGPVNSFGGFVKNMSPDTTKGFFWLFFGLMLLLAWWGLRKVAHWYREGDLGRGVAIAASSIILFPFAYALTVTPLGWVGGVPFVIALIPLAGLLKPPEFRYTSSSNLGTGLLFGMGILSVLFALLGLGCVALEIHDWASSADGLNPPKWLSSSVWAKPALMLMGLWGSLGSGNMLLYLAGLSNVPQELYEAAEIDGATPLQRFWNVTWPQLAPITFFIVVMSVIGGLQGGFEVARSMTQGGPQQATTTLSYFIYTEGFETGRLGYSSAISWTLFALVFALTVFNWKFGNKYVNE